MTTTDVTTTRTALIHNSPTDWGDGTTSCFNCGQGISYPTGRGGTIPSVRGTSGLCDHNCAPGGHRWDCAALGGDLCTTCLDLAANSPEWPRQLTLTAAEYRRRADILDLYAAATWTRDPKVTVPTPE